ncbi:MAG: NAD(P)H-dependent flavin oxidoreductase [Marmoricola sp.]
MSTPSRVLDRLGVTLPVLAAPMAGGPSTPELVVAAASAGSMGFLAGGYKTAGQMLEQIREIRAAGVPFGVNLFAPNPVPVDPQAYATYAEQLAVLGQRFGVDPREVALREDDDDWEAKIAALIADPVPVLTFTFGIPDRPTIEALRTVGTWVGQTVTSAAEARLASAAGVDGLVVQSARAGGHSGTLTPAEPVEDLDPPELVRRVRAVTDLPLWAGGGVSDSDDVRHILAAGAEAVAVGTLLLLSDEAGTSAAYRAGLADPARTTTLVTRAFSGRPARGARNGFTDAFDASAPAGYPAIHHLTTPLRRAAAAAGDPEAVNLWAGTGFRSARAEPAAAILGRLAAPET